MSPKFTTHSLHLLCDLQRLQEALRYDYFGSQIPKKLQDPAENWQSSTVAGRRWALHSVKQSDGTQNMETHIDQRRLKQTYKKQFQDRKNTAETLKYLCNTINQEICKLVYGQHA